MHARENNFTPLNSIAELADQGNLNRENTLLLLELAISQEPVNVAKWMQSSEFSEEKFNNIGLSKLDIVEIFLEAPVNFSDAFSKVNFLSSDGNISLSEREQFQLIKEYCSGECSIFIFDDEKIDFSFKLEPYPGKVVTMYTDRHSDSGPLGRAHSWANSFFIRKSDYSKELFLRVFFEEVFHLEENLDSSEFNVKLWREAKMNELGIEPMSPEEILEEVLTNYTEIDKTYIQKSLQSAMIHSHTINLQNLLEKLLAKEKIDIGKQLREGIVMGNKRRKILNMDPVEIPEDLLSKFS